MGGSLIVGSKVRGPQRIAAAVCNPARRCELLVTGPRDLTLQARERYQLPRRSQRAKGALEHSLPHRPGKFRGALHVLFLSAL
jgi:hypothetical protein